MPFSFARASHFQPARVIGLILGLAVLASACGRRIGEPDPDDNSKSATAPAPQTQAPSPATAPRPAPPVARTPGESWNPTQIAWQPYEDGMRLAKAKNKPVLLVFSTTWCPHCKNYSHVFEDPRVVEQARNFVMIHLDADAEETIAAKYARDGSYIPRTYFLSPDGAIDETIHAQRPRSIYFYDEHDPAPLLASMDTARRKLIN